MKQRTFLRSGVFAGAGLVLRPALGQSTPTAADRIWTGGPILTMNDRAMRVEAIAEAGGRIIAVGSRAEVMKRRGPQTQMIDLQGRALLPGFVDAHGHMMMGCSAATKDPAGGVIRRRDGSQEPDGVPEEVAFFNAAYKLLPSIAPKGMKVFAREDAKLWARFGYTTGQEGRATPGSAKLMRQVAEEGGFPIDVAIYPDVLIDRDFIKAGVSRTYVQRMRIAGAKLTIDGSPQGLTAWRDRPYCKPLGNYPPGYSGYAAASADDVMSAVSWAAENGIQVITHCNGERASDLLIASHRAAQARFPNGKATRPVLIHGQFLREDQLDSFKALDVIPSLFPMPTFYRGDWHLDHTAGPEVGMNISPTGRARKRGMIFTSHHDAPVAFPNSMRVLDATVTRRARGSGRIVDPQHRVDVITGLKAMTIWPACRIFEEETKGSLEVGKLADFVLLSKDPTAVAPTTIADIQVTETIKDGATVFRLAPAGGKTARNMTLEQSNRGALFASASSAVLVAMVPFLFLQRYCIRVVATQADR